MTRLRLLLFAAVLGVAACSQPGQAPEPAADPAAIDTKLRISNFSYELREDVGDPWALRKGSRSAVLVALRYDVTNRGDTRAPAADIPAVILVSPAQTNVYPDPDLTEGFRAEVNSGVDAKREGDINPGITTTDGVIFEIAETAWRAGGWAIQVDGVAQRFPIPAEAGAF